MPQDEQIAGRRPDSAAPPATAAYAPPQPVLLRINGTEQRLTIEPRVTLLDALREVLHLTGTKKGCDRGQCGACTVLVDGQRINACLTLAIMRATIDSRAAQAARTPARTVPRIAIRC